MATEKQLLGRIIHKHDIEENWNKATGFIPKQGEIIVYDIDNNYNYERFKIGDGNTTVINLPFQKTNINDLKAVSYDIVQTLTDEQKEQARINIGAASSIEANKPDWNKLINKPVESAGSPDTLTWDGNAEGLLAVDTGMGVVFYRVSDATISIDDFANGASFTVSNGHSGSTTYEEMLQYGVFENIILIANCGAFVEIDNCKFEQMNLTFPKAGFYIMAAGNDYLTSLTIPNYTGFATEKLKDSIIPDTVSRVGHTHSFNDLEDKPFYEETTTVQGDTLTWDGNTEGLESIQGAFFKVSDAIIGLDDIENGAIAVVTFNGEKLTLNVNYEASVELSSFYGFTTVCCNGVDGTMETGTTAAMVIPTDNFEFQSEVWSKGIYFIKTDTYGGCVTHSLTIPNYTGFVTTETVIKTIDSKFIPSEYITETELDTKGYLTELPEHTHSWNELSDKPFYETVGQAFEPIVWDGNTEGLESFQVESFGMMYTFYKVSNYVKIEPSHIESITMLVKTPETDGEQEMVAGEDMFMPDAGANEGHGWNIGGGTVLISDGQFTLRGTDGTVVPEGIWFVNSDFGDELGSARCTAMTPKTTSEVKTLDSKYLSEDIARVSDIDTKLAALVNSAPETLNTLDELAAALGDDENFANTVTTELSKKANSADLGALASKDIAEKTDLSTNVQTSLSKADTAILYTEQELIDEQKLQARTNINAQEKLTGTPDQIITFDEHGDAVVEDTANADDALITLAELGMIEPA